MSTDRPLIHRTVLHAAPYEPVDFNAKAKEIGGVHPETGNPWWRAAWGGTAYAYRKGLMRIKYPAAVANYQEIVRVDVRDVETMEVEQKKLDELSEFIRDSLLEAIKRDEHHFLFVTKLYTPIYVDVTADEGKTRWFIEEYWPADRFNPHRWKAFNRPMKREGGTLMGEFPREGQYRAFCLLETDEGKYRDLDNLVLNDLRKLVWDRNHAPKETRSEDSIIDDLEQEADSGKRLAAADFRERIRDSLTLGQVGRMFGCGVSYPSVTRKSKRGTEATGGRKARQGKRIKAA
jgi:hypothetical protein